MNKEQRRKKGPAGGGHGPAGIGRPVEKAKDFRGTVKRLMHYMRPHKWRVILVLLLAALSTLFSILSPKIMGKATTKIFEGLMAKMRMVPGAAIDFAAIGQILMVLGGLYVASALFSYIQQYVMAGVAQRTVFDMREEISQKLSRLPLKYYDSNAHGDILSRITNDVDTVSHTLQQSITQLITSVVSLVGVLVMMLTISPIMTLITLGMLPLSLIISIFAASKSQKYFAGQQRILGELNGHVEEMYTGHAIIKAYGLEEDSTSTFRDVNDELYENGWKAQFISGVIMPLIGLVGNIGYVVISVAGGIFASRGLITIGDIQAFIQYSRQFTMPITQTASIVNILQSTVAAAERVFELLDEEEELADADDAVTITNPKGEIELSNVQFGYDPVKTVIKDLSLKVNPGQTIAIVGPTGAGKTTLVNLLMRFYDVDGGTITFDGHDIMQIKRGNLRTMFGMVLQDTWLFEGTIRENIAYGRSGATDDEIEAAAAAAHADHFIRTLPDGYDTILKEDASNISQGQKQLLTIARAILADPTVLILDEATSSVDTRTELLIQQAMGRLMEGRTSFVIAHRLSTIHGADRILVINQGEIVEQGTHEELLKMDGFYAELYYSQFAAQLPDKVG
ncbi:MAG: ABC transporter ATP-binding protein [Firmicutes bacterium]|jgi:ATP-binding cassette subfamily B multidrug efflux pump|nr:ABC transporter ATP-binding protein [Bacillota bacterium]